MELIVGFFNSSKRQYSQKDSDENDESSAVSAVDSERLGCYVT